MGKTIQIIALMVTNQRNSKHQLSEAGKHDVDEDEDEAETKDKAKLKAKQSKTGYGKTTLIVAPASLLHQVHGSLLHSYSVIEDYISGEKRLKQNARTVFCVFTSIMANTSSKQSKTSKLLVYVSVSVNQFQGDPRLQVILVSYQTLTAEFPTKLDTSDQSGWLPEMGCVYLSWPCIGIVSCETLMQWYFSKNEVVPCRAGRSSSRAQSTHAICSVHFPPADEVSVVSLWYTHL